jgi:hypothetical protein
VPWALPTSISFTIAPGASGAGAISMGMRRTGRPCWVGPFAQPAPMPFGRSLRAPPSR